VRLTDVLERVSVRGGSNLLMFGFEMSVQGSPGGEVS